MEAYVKNPPLPKQYGDKFLVFERGEGCNLFDRSGECYLDMGSGIAVNALGYGRQDLADIAAKQMARLIHVSNLFTTPPQLELAQKLVGMASSNRFESVHFGNSGAEANETAMKYARLYAKMQKGDGHHRLIAFHNSFHGRTMGALSLTHNPAYREPFAPLLPGCEFLPFNNIDALMDAVDTTVAGIIVEPIQGEGGLEQLSRDFAQALNTVSRKHDVLLIADEVQTGLGRCGFPFATELMGLKPDLVTLAKPLAGGLPLSAVLVPPKIHALLKPGHHATTFGGGPVTTAVASAVLEITNQPDFLAEVRRKGKVLTDLLYQGLGKRSGEVRGAGLLQGLQLTGKQYDGAWCRKIITEMQKRKVIILKSGVNVLRIAPPLVISDAEITTGIQTLFDVINATT